MQAATRTRAARAAGLLVAALWGVACARSEGAAAEFRLLSVTTTAATPLPGRLIDLFVAVANETDEELRVIELELQSDAAAESIWLTRVTPLPVVLAAHTQGMVQGSARLPFAYAALTIDAGATAVSVDGRDVRRARRAEVPLRLHAPQNVPPTDTDLVVTVTNEEEDGGPTAQSLMEVGGGSDLSLREAVTIANNRPGADLIRFDPGVFPPSAPTRLLYDRALGPLRVTSDELALDGGGAGVIVSPVHYTNRNGEPVIAIQANGVSLARLTFELEVSLVAVSISACTGCMVRDCRILRVPGDIYSNVGIDVVASSSLLFEDLTLADVDWGISLNASTDVTVRRVEHTVGAVGLGVDGSSRVLVEDVRFDGLSDTVAIWSSDEVRLVRATLSGAYFFCLAAEASTRSGIEDSLLYDCGNPFSGLPGGGIGIASGSSGISARRTRIEGTTLIAMEPGSNGDLAAPSIANPGPPVRGTSSAPAGSAIDLYVGEDDPGGLFMSARLFLGEAVVDASGNWAVTPAWPPESGHTLRATVTDLDGNTSEMSAPVDIP